jgi:hypothetical protein
MALSLTPAMVEAAYELLRTTPPFRGWRLPPSDEVEFRVTDDRAALGSCRADRACIAISGHLHGHLSTLLATLAHEMLHLWQERRGTGRRDVVHDHEFRRVARRIARLHGFDPRLF